jgi:hypothetical protein
VLKVSEYDTRTHWREQLGLERFNRLMQGDVAKNIKKYWINTKDLALPQLEGHNTYEELNIVHRRHLAKISGVNPNKMHLNLANHQKNLIVQSGDNTANSGQHEMEKMESESRVLSENDSINVPSKAEDKYQNETSVRVPKLNTVNNMSLQEINTNITDDRMNLSDRDKYNHQISEPMSETMIQEHFESPNHERRNTGSPAEMLQNLNSDKDLPKVKR